MSDLDQGNPEYIFSHDTIFLKLVHMSRTSMVLGHVTESYLMQKNMRRLYKKFADTTVTQGGGIRVDVNEELKFL